MDQMQLLETRETVMNFQKIKSKSGKLWNDSWNI